MAKFEARAYQGGLAPAKMVLKTRVQCCLFVGT